MGKRNSPEHDIQKAVIQWRNNMLHVYPELALLHAIPNGESRPKTMVRGSNGWRAIPLIGKRLKDEGVLSGVPDFDLPVDRGVYSGLRIEVKAERGGLKAEQRWWLTRLEAQGRYCCVRRSVGDIMVTIKKYLSLKDGEEMDIPIGWMRRGKTKNPITGKVEK